MPPFKRLRSLPLPVLVAALLALAAPGCAGALGAGIADPRAADAAAWRDDGDVEQRPVPSSGLRSERAEAGVADRAGELLVVLLVVAVAAAAIALPILLF